MTIMDKRNFLRGIVGAAAAAGGTAHAEEAEECQRLKPLPPSPMFNYRTVGSWGEGNGGPLDPAQVDENFWRIEQLIRRLYAAQA